MEICLNAENYVMNVFQCASSDIKIELVVNNDFSETETLNKFFEFWLNEDQTSTLKFILNINNILCDVVDLNKIGVNENGIPVLQEDMIPLLSKLKEEFTEEINKINDILKNIKREKEVLDETKAIYFRF